VLAIPYERRPDSEWIEPHQAVFAALELPVDDAESPALPVVMSADRRPQRLRVGRRVWEEAAQMELIEVYLRGLVPHAAAAKVREREGDEVDGRRRARDRVANDTDCSPARARIRRQGRGSSGRRVRP